MAAATLYYPASPAAEAPSQHSGAGSDEPTVTSSLPSSILSSPSTASIAQHKHNAAHYPDKPTAGIEDIE